MESLECRLLDHSSAIQYRSEDRGRLYYDRYTWSITWQQPEISALRHGLESHSIIQCLANRREWRSTYINRKMVSLMDITEAMEDDLLILAAQLRQLALPFKMVFCANQLTVYTNHEQLVEQVAKIASEFASGPVRVKQARLTHPEDTLVMKRAHAYQYRTYLRSRPMDTAGRQTLANWIRGMSDDIQASGSLMAFLQGRKTRWYRSDRTWEYHYIDHNDPKLLLWLAMISPDLARKTMTIQSGAK